MSQGWSTLKCNSPRGRNLRTNFPGWRLFEVSRRRARSSLLKSRLPRSWSFLKPRVALILPNVAAAASIMGASRRSIEGSSHRHLSRYCTALARSREALRAERGLFELLVHVVALAPSGFSRPSAHRAKGGTAQLGAFGSRAGAHRVPQGHPRRVVCCRAPLEVCRPCRFAQPEAGGQRPRSVERYLLFRRPGPAAHRPHGCAPRRFREARKATRRTDPRRLSGCGREACG